MNGKQKAILIAGICAAAAGTATIIALQIPKIITAINNNSHKPDSRHYAIEDEDNIL